MQGMQHTDTRQTALLHVHIEWMQLKTRIKENSF